MIIGMIKAHPTENRMAGQAILIVVRHGTAGSSCAVPPNACGIRSDRNSAERVAPPACGWLPC
jgi:hypothetical protein